MRLLLVYNTVVFFTEKSDKRKKSKGGGAGYRRQIPSKQRLRADVACPLPSMQAVYR